MMPSPSVLAVSRNSRLNSPLARTSPTSINLKFREVRSECLQFLLQELLLNPSTNFLFLPNSRKTSTINPPGKPDWNIRCTRSLYFGQDSISIRMLASLALAFDLQNLRSTMPFNIPVIPVSVIRLPLDTLLRKNKNEGIVNNHTKSLHTPPRHGAGVSTAGS